jgi:UTP--glucose-1-phosphate uridylyltransferase
MLQRMKPIRKAVFPVAGLGTRFLPATKAMPKEMLPVVDRPLIQHVVDEAREAGIEHFIFVTGRNKGVIEDHFDRQFELEQTLTERQRQAELDKLAHDLPGPGTTSFTRQQLPLGLGHAVWCARELVGNEPFALLLPDVLVQHAPGCLAQMIEAAREVERANIIAVEEVPAERVHMYGVVGVGERRGKLLSLTQMVEKPARETAPSNLIITGRYPAASRSTPCSSPGAASTVAPRSASSPPTWPMHWRDPTSRRRCGPSWRSCSARVDAASGRLDRSSVPNHTPGTAEHRG